MLALGGGVMGESPDIHGILLRALPAVGGASNIRLAYGQPAPKLPIATLWQKLKSERGLHKATQSHPKATPRPVDRHRIGTLKPPQGYPKATPRPPQGHPKATPRLPQGYPKATPRPPQGHPKATPRLPQGYPKATPRLPQGYPEAIAIRHGYTSTRTTRANIKSGRPPACVRGGRVCIMHDAWGAFVQIAMILPLSAHTQGDAKTL
jgi:hypothetical protein